MTTVAADSTMMAADSQAATDTVKTSVPKLFKVRGWYIGVAGDYGNALALIECIKAQRGETPFEYLKSRDAIAKGVGLLLLSPTGQVYESEEGGCPQKLTEGFGAIGTGSQGAMCLLHAGYSPAEAVKIVRKVDPNTGGRVVTRKLK